MFCIHNAGLLCRYRENYHGKKKDAKFSDNHKNYTNLPKRNLAANRCRDASH